MLCDEQTQAVGYEANKWNNKVIKTFHRYRKGLIAANDIE